MDYNELRNRTGMEITRDQYNVIENVYLNTDKFKDVAAVVSFFKAYGFKDAYEQIVILNHDIIRRQYEKCADELMEAQAWLEEATVAKNEAIKWADDYKARYIDSRRELKEVSEAKDAEIAKLNALLDAYRKVVDLSRFTQDEMVIALANGGVRL